MKSSCTQEKLLDAIGIAERVVGKKESLPVLSCILVEASKGMLFVRATNLETGVEIRIPAEVTEVGMVAVPVNVLSQTVRATRGGKMELASSDEGNLTITSSGGTTTIKTTPPDEFPSIPTSDVGTTYTISPKVITEAIQGVSYAASSSMIRPELASILMTYQDGFVRCVATDSFRLAEKSVPYKLSSGFPDTLLPVKNALELVHVLSNIDEDVECGFDESQLTVKAGTVRFVSRIIDATFPQYQEIIPKEFVAEAILLKEDFNTVVKKARIFSYTSQETGLHLYPSRKEFVMTARTADVGETSDSLDATVKGVDLDIKFNIHYLSECLPSIHADSIEMKFGGIGKPLVIQGVSDPSFLYLVMPLNR